MQVQLEEEKLKPTSAATSSVFIDGVEFVRVRYSLVVVDAAANSCAGGSYPFPAQQKFRVGVIFAFLAHRCVLTTVTQCRSLFCLFVLQEVQVK